MLDPDFTHLYLNRFPEELTQVLMKYYQEYKVGEGGVPKYRISPDKHSIGVSYSFLIDDEILLDVNGIDFYMIYIVSHPDIGMAGIHADRRRDFSLNVPIKVDHEKSKVLVMDGPDLEKYGPISVEIENGVEGKYWHEAIESDFLNLNLDAPMLLNTTKPHGWTNYSDEIRVIASLTADPKHSLKEVYQALKKYV